MVNQLITAFLLSALIVALALWRGSLSPSGAAGAMVIGTVTFGLGGWQWGTLLALFFVSSSLLSHFKEAEKQVTAEKFDKGHSRDVGQVMANGGLGALAAILSAVAPAATWFPFFVGAMATVTADTWATELGTLSKQRPRLITNGRRVEAGTSGAISLPGTTVSLVGGLLIGLSAGWLTRQNSAIATAIGPMVAIGALSGLTGSLFDSLLGATVQRIYYCDACHKDTERRRHKCGQITRPWRGWAWLNNDMVNLLSSLVGGLTAVGLWLWFRPI
jgi:uncharacterized protein (TIGR00297 family)